MDTITIPKDFIVSMLAVSRQLVRSLDLSIHSEWKDFLRFFGDKEILIYSAVLARLSRIGPRSEEGVPGPKAARKLPWLKSIWARCLFLISGRVRLPQAELRLFESALKRSIQAIESEDRPTDREIIDLRTQLASCEFVIGQRVGGSVLRDIKSVDHFNSSLYLNFRPLEEFVKTGL